MLWSGESWPVCTNNERLVFPKEARIDTFCILLVVAMLCIEHVHVWGCASLYIIIEVADNKDPRV